MQTLRVVPVPAGQDREAPNARLETHRALVCGFDFLGVESVEEGTPILGVPCRWRRRLRLVGPTTPSCGEAGRSGERAEGVDRNDAEREGA